MPSSILLQLSFRYPAVVSLFRSDFVYFASLACYRLPLNMCMLRAGFGIMKKPFVVVSRVLVCLCSCAVIALVRQAVVSLRLLFFKGRARSKRGEPRRSSASSPRALPGRVSVEKRAFTLRLDLCKTAMQRICDYLHTPSRAMRRRVLLNLSFDFGGWGVGGCDSIVFRASYRTRDNGWVDAIYVTPATVHR